MNSKAKKLNLSTILFRIRESLTIAMLLGIIWVGVHAYQGFTAHELKFESGVTAQVAAGAAAANTRLDAAAWVLDAKLDKLTNKAGSTLDAATALLNISGKQVRTVDIAELNRQIASVGGSASTTLDYATQTIGALQPIGPALVNTLQPIKEAAYQADAALPDFLDCQVTDEGIGNKGCLYARLNDLSSETDQTLLAIARAAPRVAGSVAGVTEDSHAITSDVKRWVDKETAPPSRWDRIRGWLEVFLYPAMRLLGL